jgi:hypothetical protein
MFYLGFSSSFYFLLKNREEENDLKSGFFYLQDSKYSISYSSFNFKISF